MNIILKTTTNNIVTRPDTSLNKETEDLYLPSFITDLSYSPILFVRISKAGKAIGEKFAQRYYDAFNYGMVLFAENLITNQVASYSTASLIDKTSFMPMPLYPMEQFQENNVFNLYINNTLQFTHSCNNILVINNLITEASTYISLRIGDIVGIELADRTIINKQQNINITGVFCNNFIFESNIKF